MSHPQVLASVPYYLREVTSVGCESWIVEVVVANFFVPVRKRGKKEGRKEGRKGEREGGRKEGRRKKAKRKEEERKKERERKKESKIHC